ncbi:MAG TPA: hypothetical protein VF634_02660, partial [Pyrinomonadaceae bacterium]
QDYFWYYDEPLYENGLPVRDMIVFRRDLAAETGGEQETVVDSQRENFKARFDASLCVFFFFAPLRE